MIRMKRGKTAYWRVIPAVLLALALAGAVTASEYQAPAGRFSMRIPDGWTLTPQTDPNVYVFKGAGYETIIIEYVPGEGSPDRLLKKAKATFGASGVVRIAPDGKADKTEVNGRPARWGYQTGLFSQNSAKLNAATGAVAVTGGGLFFLSILNDASRASLGGSIEASFRSIR